MATTVQPQDTEWHTVGGKNDKRSVKKEYVQHSDLDPTEPLPIKSDNPYATIGSPKKKTTKMSTGDEDITTTTTKTKTTTTYPARATSSSMGGLSSYFGPSSSFGRNRQKWLLGASVLGLSLLVALTAISLSHTIGSTKSAMDFAKDKAQQLSSQGLADDAWDRAQHERLHPSQLDSIGDRAAQLKNQGEAWMDHSKRTGESWWSTWSHWLSGELEHAEDLAGNNKDKAKDAIKEGNAKAQKKLVTPEQEGAFMRAYHYLFSRSEADEAAKRAREYANEARDAVRPTVWERMKHAIGQSSAEERVKFFAESGIDEAGNIVDKAKFDLWEAAINAKDQIKEKATEIQDDAKDAVEPSLSERVAHAFHHHDTVDTQDVKDTTKDVKEKLEEYYDQAREAAHPTLWARFKNAFGQATPVERAQIFASAGLDESGRIVDKVKFAAYQKALYAKDQAQVYADDAKSRLHPTVWARMKHAFGQATPTERAQIYATAGLDDAGNVVDKVKFAAWEQASKLKAASKDSIKDLKHRAEEATRPPTMWERISSSFHHEPTYTERAHDAKTKLDQYYDAAKNAAHPTLWARFKNAFGQATPAERAQIYAAAGLDEAGTIVDKVKFAAYEQALRAKDAVNIYTDKSKTALHPTAWARLKNVFGQASTKEQAQIYAAAGLDASGNIVDKAKFKAWNQAVKLKGAAYDAAGSLRRTVYPEPTLYEKFRNLFVTPPTTTARAQDLAARGLYATRDAAQQAYETAREAVQGHEPTMGERISGLFHHKPTKAERARIYAESLIDQAKAQAGAVHDRLYPEPTLGQKIRHLFVRDDTPAEKARYLASAGIDQAGNIIDKAKFSAWEQALKIKAAAHDATHPSVWEKTKAVFVEPTPAQKAKLYAGQVLDSPSAAYEKLKHQYAHEPSMLEKITGYFTHEETTAEKAKHTAERAADYVRSSWSTPEPTFGERISSAFSGSDLTTAQRVADSLHGAADNLRTEPTLTDRVRAAVYGAPEPTLAERARQGLADVVDAAGHRVHHEPTLAEKATAAANKIRESVGAGVHEPTLAEKIKDAVLPNRDEHLKEQEKERMRQKAHEAIDKNVK